MKRSRVSQVVAGSMMVFVAACGGADAPAKSVGGAAPQPLPPADAACAAPPPMMECADGDARCIAAQEDNALAWRDWTLRCAPVMPEHPIAGEDIDLTIPHPPGGTGPCTSGGIQVDKVAQRDATLIRVRNGGSGDCRSTAGLAAVPLGQLPPGNYRVDTGYWQTSFVVRPAGSDPGPLPAGLRAALAVAEVRDPGRCFGMPPGDERGVDAARFGKQRIARQLRKAFPGRPLEELERLHQRASSISVSPAGAGRWTYEYSDGACCTISQVRGELRLDADGRYVVGPATVVDSKTVPC